MAMSLLPWFIFSRRVHVDVFNPEAGEYRSHESEVMEYMITIALPRRLRKTIYIEGEGNTIYLRSRADKSFHKVYTLPAGFEVDDCSYEYEGKYLLLKLKLKRSVR